MAYIGTSPSNGVRRIHTYTATAGQTTFTGSSTEGVTLSYADTNYIDVFQNGVLLGSADYTSTSGTSVVLAQGASVSDLVVIVVYDVFSVADTVSKTAGGSFDSAVTANAGVKVDNITIDGTEIDLSSGDLTLDVAGDIILDADGAEVKFQDAGTLIGFVSMENTDLTIQSSAQNRDIIFKGDDGGSGIEAARFDMSEDGALCLGATSRVGAGVLSISFNDAAAHGIDIQVEADSSGGAFAVFRKSSGGVIGQINRNGTSDAVQYTTSSDYRLKENVNYDFDATTTLKKLKPCEFNWISDEKNTTIAGFIAHEVQSVVPNAVNGEKDETEILKDADGKEQTIIKPQGLDKSDLVPLLTKALQEQQATIEALTARITALESK